MDMFIFFICTAIFLYNIYSIPTGDIDWSSKALKHIFNDTKSFRQLEDTIKEFNKELNKPPKNKVMNQSDILINKITEKNTKLNNTISNSLLGTARDLHSLFTQYNDESSQKEIIRQLEAISEFLDTQIEKACLPGSKAYINKTLSTSSFYIKSVIENDNWVE